jgi:hypothetical protein
MPALKGEAEMIGEGYQTEEVVMIEGQMGLYVIAGVVGVGEPRITEDF